MAFATWQTPALYIWASHVDLYTLVMSAFDAADMLRGRLQGAQSHLHLDHADVE